MFTKRFNFMSFAGIKIGIDVSWLFIAIILSWTLASGHFPLYYPHLSSSSYWFMGIIGMLGLFVCVILHELGHALVAKHYKLPISQITLFIFGGIAEIEKEPKTPKTEFLIAIAGPIVSLVLSFFMYVLFEMGVQLKWPVQIVAVVSYLAIINLVLAMFNLIPAFPLDGGRMLRAALWGWKKNLAWATQIATGLGSGFGFFLILMGIFSFITGNILGGIWMAIIGLFLQRASTASFSQFYVDKELRKEKVAKFMIKDPVSVPSDITLKEFVEEYVYQSYHHFYPVVGSLGDLLGYISLREVKAHSQEEWAEISVKTAMVCCSLFKTISPNMSALEALDFMQKTELPVALVVEKGRFLGIVTARDLFKLIALKLELKEE